MSTSNEKPCEFQDETHRFSDSNQVTYKVPKYDHKEFLFFSLQPEKDCILKAHATAQAANGGQRRRGNSMKSPMNGVICSDVSFNSSYDRHDRNISLDPSKRQVYIEMLHKKDNSSSQYLQLDFGEFLIDKKVRDRAIADRVE